MKVFTWCFAVLIGLETTVGLCVDNTLSSIGAIVAIALSTLLYLSVEVLWKEKADVEANVQRLRTERNVWRDKAESLV